MVSYFLQITILYWRVIRVYYRFVDIRWEILSLTLSSLLVLTAVVEVVAGRWGE